MTMNIKIIRFAIIFTVLFVLLPIIYFYYFTHGYVNRKVNEQWKYLKMLNMAGLSVKASMQSRLVYKVPYVDCERLFRGDKVETSKNWTGWEAGSHTNNLRVRGFLDMSRSSPDYCTIFKEERRYITEPLSQEEADFPLAFSIMVFKDVELFERLLRAIYRPQNYYCIHIDLSSDKLVQDAVRTIVKCFTNVFIPVNLVDVEYRTFSSLQADLVCMRELLVYKHWRYFINLTGQEFPLQTSISIVRILTIFNGTNSLEGTVKRRNNERYTAAGPLPVNLTVTKGAVHIIATRAFVDYAINNETAIKFLAWVSKTGDPDETFFSTLNHNPQLGVPGAYTGEPESFTEEYPFIARFKNWVGAGPIDFPCAGKVERGICIFGVGDLPLLSRRPELFANKFHIDVHPQAYACMEELLLNRTLEELSGVRVFNASAYEQLSFVKHHV